MQRYDASHGYTELARRPGFSQLDRRHDPVETLWSVQGDKQGDFLVLPDGRADLILYFQVRQDGRCAGIVPMVVGPSSFAHSVDVLPGHGWLGVRFRPGRLSSLGDVSDIADARLVSDAAISRVPALADVPIEAPSMGRLVSLFQGIVSSLDGKAPPSEVDVALDRLHLAGGRITAAGLSQAVDVGPRRLHRLFARYVGLPPKTYAEVIRLQRAVRLRRRGFSLAATALEAGYADQAHMTRAFRARAGVTPARMPDVALGWMPFT